MHSTDNLEDSYVGSGKRLWFSLNYHGKENHVNEVLEFLPDRKSLSKREEEIVNSDLIKEDLCMNLIPGGECGISTEYRKKAAKITNTKYKDKKVEWGAMGGKTTIKKYGYQVLLDNICDWTGKKHLSESKKKMSESSKGCGVGKTNSQYGTCWITKGGLNKKIKKEELPTWLTEGWLMGRNLK